MKLEGVIYCGDNPVGRQLSQHPAPLLPQCRSGEQGIAPVIQVIRRLEG